MTQSKHSHSESPILGGSCTDSDQATLRHSGSSPDRNFDDLAERFQKTIYDTPKGQLRLSALKADFEQLAIPCAQQSVLDLGGGQGQFSHWLASKQANVHLCDVSEDMINRAQQRFKQSNLPLKAVCCPLQSADEYFNQTYPIVLNHAVLEWLEQPFQALEQITRFVAPQGWISLMFYNLHGHQWRQLMNGRTHAPKSANQRLRREGNSPQHPLDPQAVMSALASHGFSIKRWRGIRCIHDHMHQKIRERIGQEAVNKADLEFGLQDPYRQLGRYIHVVAQR